MQSLTEGSAKNINLRSVLLSTISTKEAELEIAVVKKPIVVSVNLIFTLPFFLEWPIITKHFLYRLKTVHCDCENIDI